MRKFEALNSCFKLDVKGLLTSDLARLTYLAVLTALGLYFIQFINLLY